MVTIYDKNIFSPFKTLLPEILGHQFSNNRVFRGLIRNTKDDYAIGNVGANYQFPSDGVLTSFNWYSLSTGSFNMVVFGEIINALCEIKHHVEVDDAEIN